MELCSIKNSIMLCNPQEQSWKGCSGPQHWTESKKRAWIQEYNSQLRDNLWGKDVYWRTFDKNVESNNKWLKST
jgi:hypothetical protein